MNCDATDRPRPLIAGIGNTLRGDDAVGIVVVERFDALVAGARPDQPPPRTLTCHQLTPDLAVDVHDAGAVVFVDASCELPPGEIRMQRLVAADDAPPIGHQLGPAHLLALTQAMFGRVPPAWTLAVGAAGFEHGRHLTRPVADAVEPMIDCLNAWCAQHGEACHA